MKHILFFDTETTGLPLKDFEYEVLLHTTKGPVMQYNYNGYPRIAQLSWILATEDGNDVQSGDFFIKPDGWVMPAGTSEFNGIWQRDLEANGKPIMEVLTSFFAAMSAADVIAGHNLEYDNSALDGELHRLKAQGWTTLLQSKRMIDTMTSTVEFCAIPFPEDKPRHYDTGCEFKYPRLTELHSKLFGCVFDGAHNSMCDVEATKKCFFELVKQNVIEL